MEPITVAFATVVSFSGLNQFGMVDVMVDLALQSLDDSSRPLLEAYDSTAGQLWLIVVLGIFGLGGWLMTVYGRMELPERFSARRGPDGRPGVVGPGVFTSHEAP